MNASASTPIAAGASTPSQDEIAQCARELWTESGKPEGRDIAIWLDAEHRLLSARRAPGVTAVVLPPPSTPPARTKPPQAATAQPSTSTPRKRP